MFDVEEITLFLIWPPAPRVQGPGFFEIMLFIHVSNTYLQETAGDPQLLSVSIISILLLLWSLVWESWYLFLIFREVKQTRPTDQSPHHRARPSEGIQSILFFCELHTCRLCLCILQSLLFLFLATSANCMWTPADDSGFSADILSLSL